MKERRRITIVVGEETRLSFSCLVEFATCVYIVQSKWDVAGMLSKNLHMTVRFHVVLRVRTLIPIYIYIYTHYIYVYTQGTRCSETKECSMSYEHEGVQGLRSRKQAALSLPEYISVTAYRVCMKRFKYLNYPLFDKFSLATFERSVTLSETNRSKSLIRVALKKERKCGYLVSLRRNEKYFFFPLLLCFSSPPNPIRYVYEREENKKKGGGGGKRERVNLISGR